MAYYSGKSANIHIWQKMPVGKKKERLGIARPCQGLTGYNKIASIMIIIDITP